MLGLCVYKVCVAKGKVWWCGGVVVWCGVGCTAVIDYCDIVITNYTGLSSRDVLFTFYLS